MIRPLAILFFSCLMYSCGDKGEQAVEKEITWSGTVAGIIYSHCASCHRAGGSGPFPLTNYSETVRRGAQIRFVTKTGYMPPWPADPSYRHFANERVMSQQEISAIDRWVQNGMPRGDSALEPQPPVSERGSYFGRPDLVLRPLRPVQIRGDGKDAFLIMKFPYSLPSDTVLDFVEFVPHRRKIIHHVNGHLLGYEKDRKFDHFSGEHVHADERQKMAEIYRRMSVPYTDGKEPAFPAMTPNVVYYLPGFIPPVYPPEVGGYRMKKDGMFFLNNIHYGPSATNLADSSYLNVYFRKRPVSRPMQEAQMGTFGISPIEPEFVIPPGEIRTFHTATRLKDDISLLSVNPHMHLIGSRFLAFALGPDKDTIPLIRINKWNFRWQYYYTYKRPVVLKAGTEIHVYGTFDNTVANPDNPFRPPRVITQGDGIESMKTSEEMFQFIFTYLPYRAGDENIDLERRD